MRKKHNGRQRNDIKKDIQYAITEPQAHLNVFKVVCVGLVIDFNAAFKNDQWISGK